MGPYGQDGMLLQQMAGGFAPVVSGRQHVPMTGLEGIPGMDQGGLTGMMMQMFVAPKLQQMMGPYGFSPMGIGHDMNIYDMMRNQQFTLAQQEAARIASDMDRGNYMRTFRGVAAMTGTPWGAEQRRAARQLADTAGVMSPILAEMFPDLLDQMGGMRGSATVMANRMMMGSRYRLDPLSGRMGQTAETVGDMTKQIYRDLYENGDLAQMKGITAGQLGTMYDELTRRGMIMGPQAGIRTQTMEAVLGMAGRDRAGLERAAMQQGVALPANLQDLGAEDLEKLRLDPGIAARLRSFDAERVKRSLKSYVDVVGAVRDIFGDMGRPDAPMSELITALETMTQGGVGQIDPGRLNMMVRTTGELAKQSGMSIDSALAMQQHAASRAQQLGISPLHAVQAAQGGMAWGSAFRAQGGSAVPAWGRMGADQMMQLDTNLRMQAASSEQAQRLAVMMRVRDRVGGFQEGSTAEAMSNAIMAGQTEFMDPTTGEMRSTRMTGSEFAGIMQGARGRGGQNLGIDEGTLASLLNQRFTNEQFIEQHGIAGQVRRQMTQDTREWLGMRYREAISQRLRAAGMDEEEADKIASRSSLRVSNRVGELSHAKFADDRTRTDEMARIMREEISAAGGRNFIRDNNLGEDFFQLSAEQTYGYINRTIRHGQMRGFGSYQNIHAATNEETGLQASRNAMQARFSAEVADAMAPLGRGSILQRAVQYMQDAGESKGKDGMTGLISAAFGGVANEDIQSGLQAPLLKVRDTRAALEELQQKYMRAPSSEEKTRIMRQIEEQRAALKAESENLVNVAEQYGIFTEGNEMLSPEDATNAIDSIRAMAISQQDLAGLSGDFAHRVSQAEIDRVTGTKFTNMDVAAGARLQRELKAAGDDEEAKAKIEQEYGDASGRFTDAAMETWMAESTIGKDEARDVILARRNMVSLVPTEAQVEQYLRENEGADVRQAETVLTARARAQRFGLDEATIKAAMNRLAPDQRTEDRAIDLAIQERMGHQLDVSNEELAKYRVDHPEFERSSDESVRKEIRRERMDESKQRWQQFWESDSGAAFREGAETAWTYVDDVATRMMMSQKMMRKLGPGAIESFKTIRGRQQQMRELAAQYTDGDMARLLAGDFTNIDDPAVLKAVRQEVFDLQGSLTSEMAGLRDRMGKKGRQWGESEATARALLGLPTDIAAPLTADQEKQLEQMRRDVTVAQQLTDDDIKQIETFQTTHDTITARAKALGVTGDELGKFLAGGLVPKGREAIFDVLSNEDITLSQDTLDTWRKQYAEHDRIKRALDARRKDLAEEKDPAKRTKIEADIARLEAEKQTAKDAVGKTLGNVSGLAKARGMSEEDFITRFSQGGLMTADTMSMLRDTYKQQQEMKQKLDARAGEITGARGVEDLVGGMEAIEKVDQMGQDFRDMETRSTGDYLKGIFAKTGLDVEQHRDFIGQLSTQTGSETGRGFARRIIGTTEQLGGYAAAARKKLEAEAAAETDPAKKKILEARANALRGEAVISSGELVDQYMEAKKDDKSLAEFRGRIGLAGKDKDEEFASFQRAADFYQWTGMERLDDLKPSERASRLAEIMQSLDKGAQYRTPQVQEGEEAQRAMTITGTLKIVGETGDINAESGPR